ncbi:dynein light chain DLC [Besnoitia besnoiti]|uniref:Dynein light chain n=1 Tax=Besnoitia besnoiti TaxID=94643 RepID=A0A2A9MP36_BESBE|nr:dynein light chain DLC [Besnoitia besnoiti]PFH38066.1 dynein light chain DLC [Besnoitia besnoiti]
MPQASRMSFWLGAALRFQAVEMFKNVRDIADHIKQFFDSKHQPTWNCIVGRYFGSKVTYESKRYIYFSVGQLSVLLWRCA